MHRVYCEQIPEEGWLELGSEASHYLGRVLRLVSGNRVLVFDDSGWECLAEIEEIDKRCARLRVLERRRNLCEPVSKVWLAQGYPKGTKFFDIVRDVTALGVSGVAPFLALRSVAGQGGKSDAWQERCERIALEASRQCGRVHAPRIADMAESLGEALDAVQPEAEPVAGLCLWEEAGEPLEECLKLVRHAAGQGRPVVVVIGPEGGLTPEEAEAARGRGLSLCRMGPRILRTELAPVAALSILQYALGEMGEERRTE